MPLNVCTSLAGALSSTALAAPGSAVARPPVLRRVRSRHEAVAA